MVSVLRLSSRHACCSDLLKKYVFPTIWSIADEYPDPVTRLHTQARLMSNFGLNASVPWLKDTKGAICFFCKEDTENTDHFLPDSRDLTVHSSEENFGSIWCNLDPKIMRSNPTDCIQIADFINGYIRQHKMY